MSAVRPCALPDQALLRKHRDVGAYTDCFVTEVPGVVSHRAFVEAFYTTPLFKVERALLSLFANRPSTDAQARQWAMGDADTFSAWHVECRSADQLLVAWGRTRSWFMVAPAGDGSAAARVTRLYFGSAVIPRPSPHGGRPDMGLGFAALQGFHKLYSRALLAAARSRLRAGGAGIAA
jgi:hypothetical protein